MAHREKQSQSEDRGTERAKGDPSDSSTEPSLISESMITPQTLSKRGLAVAHEMSLPRLNHHLQDTGLCFFCCYCCFVNGLVTMKENSSCLNLP